MLHDGELEMDQVVRMHPVLCRLADEGTLAASGAGIALHRMTSGTDEII